MAQKTSDLWKTLWYSSGTRQEFGFDINGVWYGPEAEVQHSVDSGLFESFSIGNAATAKLTLKLFASSVPRAAVIKRFVRLRNKNQVSEWLPKGVFFTNRRSEEDGLWTIEAFDAMRKAEQRWQPRQNLIFPLDMYSASLALAQAIETSLDGRSVLNPAFTIDYPADYTIRDQLRYIAAAHGGNWIVTDEGNLLLVSLDSIREESNYLVTEYGAAIVFGGVRILAG